MVFIFFFGKKLFLKQHSCKPNLLGYFRIINVFAVNLKRFCYIAKPWLLTDYLKII